MGNKFMVVQTEKPTATEHWHWVVNTNFRMSYDFCEMVAKVDGVQEINGSGIAMSGYYCLIHCATMFDREQVRRNVIEAIERHLNITDGSSHIFSNIPLQEQLQRALDAEDYELAAILKKKIEQST